EAISTKKPPYRVLGGKTRCCHLPLERFLQSSSQSVSWLAASPYSLRLPKVRGLSGLRRFRSAYSCGAALVLHQLPWSQASPVTIWLSSSQLLGHYTTGRTIVLSM